MLEKCFRQNKSIGGGCKLFFFYLVFVSRTFTNHRTTRKEGGYSINSSLPLPPASQNRYLDISRAITAESSPLHIASNQTRTGKPLVSERKSLTTKLHLQILNFYLVFFHSQTCGDKPNSTLSEKFGEIKPFPDIWLIIFKLFFYIFLKELDSCPSPQISYICYYIGPQSCLKVYFFLLKGDAPLHPTSNICWNFIWKEFY